MLRLYHLLRQTNLWPLKLPDGVILYLFEKAHVFDAIGVVEAQPVVENAVPDWLSNAASQVISDGEPRLLEYRHTVIYPIRDGQRLVGAAALVGAGSRVVGPLLGPLLNLLSSQDRELQLHSRRLQQIYDQFIFLLGISKVVTSPASRDTLLRAGLKEGVDLLRAAGGILLPADPAQPPLVYGAEWALPLRDALAEAVQKHEGVILCNSVVECDDFCPALAGQVHSLASTEVWLHGRPELGLLLFDKPTPPGFLNADGQVVSFVAEQLQLVLRRDELLKEQQAKQRLAREIELASEIYQTLAPEAPPSYNGLDLHVLSLPARELGGDFYSVDLLPNGELLVVVGDAAGKGMPAALLMSQTLATLRAVALSGSSSPAQMLERSRELLEPVLGRSELFVTVFVGWLNRETLRLRYADAGHGYAFHRRSADGFVTRLKATAPPIGSIMLGPILEYEIFLEDSDALLICSDGLLELAGPHGQAFGTDRLKGLFGLMDGFTAQSGLALLSEALATFIEADTLVAGAAADDLTALLLRCERRPAEIKGRRTTRSFAGQLQSVPRFTSWAQGLALAIQGWSSTRRYGMALSAVECFTNIVRHAYDQQNSGTVDIAVTIGATGVELLIQDQGRPAELLPEDLSQVTLPDPLALAEGGYGLAIIRQLADEVSYQSGPNGNIWRLYYSREASS